MVITPATNTIVWFVEDRLIIGIHHRRVRIPRFAVAVTMNTIAYVLMGTKIAIIVLTLPLSVGTSNKDIGVKDQLNPIRERGRIRRVLAMLYMIVGNCIDTA
jgi:hypothetical protein